MGCWTVRLQVQGRVEGRGRLPGLALPAGVLAGGQQQPQPCFGRVHAGLRQTIPVQSMGFIGAVIRLFHQLYYRRWHVAERTIEVDWLGVRLRKCPLDLWIYQELTYCSFVSLG
jgi:hypothetical protein